MIVRCEAYGVIAPLSYKKMSTFDKWLSEDKEYRDKHNPFIEMFSQSLKSLPHINPPKDFEQLAREVEQENGI